MRKHDSRNPGLRLIAATALSALAIAGCGEKEEPDLDALPAPPTSAQTTPTTTTTTQPTDDGPGGALAREAEQTVEAYITWIDRGQGSRLCTLIDEDALENLQPPVSRGGCGQSLSESIGFRSRGGRPVFEGVELRELSTRVRGRSARMVATVSISFADRPQAAVEDDVIYLERRAGNWIVAKPSATLYRAIGAEVPPAALAPPR